MNLTGKQKRFLRGLSHHRKPYVTVGALGLHDNLVGEIANALERKELIKIKLPTTPRDQQRRVARQICDRTGSELVQLIGRMCIVYRTAEEPHIHLPT